MFTYSSTVPLTIVKRKFKMEDQGHKCRMYTRVKGAGLEYMLDVVFNNKGKRK